MELSIFLGRVIGVYFLIIGLAYFVRTGFLQEAVREFANSPVLMLFAAILNLIIGLLLVFGHNVWEWNWRVIITLVGYLSLIKGIFNLFYPEWARYVSERFRDRQAYTITGGVVAVIGVYLVYAAQG